MTGKEALKKAIELVEKEKMSRYNSRFRGKTDREKYANDETVRVLADIQLMLENLNNQVKE